MGLTRLSPGSCCGCVGTCSCESPVCKIPQSDLTLTLSGPGCFNGTATLTYAPLCDGVPLPCTFKGSFFCAFTRYFVLSCAGSGSVWQLQQFGVDPCGGGTALCTLDTSTADSYACSPLFIQWTGQCVSGSTITISG